MDYETLIRITHGGRGYNDPNSVASRIRVMQPGDVINITEMGRSRATALKAIQAMPNRSEYFTRVVDGVYYVARRKEQ